MDRSFASSICQKLATTIEGLETPIDVKLKLIPIFQNMHHDAQTVATVGISPFLLEQAVKKRCSSYSF